MQGTRSRTAINNNIFAISSANYCFIIRKKGNVHPHGGICRIDSTTIYVNLKSMRYSTFSIYRNVEYLIPSFSDGFIPVSINIVGVSHHICLYHITVNFTRKLLCYRITIFPLLNVHKL